MKYKVAVDYTSKFIFDSWEEAQVFIESALNASTSERPSFDVALVRETTEAEEE